MAPRLWNFLRRLQHQKRLAHLALLRQPYVGLIEDRHAIQRQGTQNLPHRLGQDEGHDFKGLVQS